MIFAILFITVLTLGIILIPIFYGIGMIRNIKGAFLCYCILCWCLFLLDSQVILDIFIYRLYNMIISVPWVG